MNRNLQAKNRAPAPIQITAEQILREARDRGLEEAPKPPKQFITDRDELAAYQLKKRKEFEDGVFRNKKNLGKWVLYGQWEAEQKEFERSRSVFERAIDVDYRNEFVWTKYAEMEMKNKFINHARNIWDRCVTLLPRNDSLWLKYTYMEELAGCVAAARAVFERFMAWEPNDLGWAAFIKFEQRQGEMSRVRGVYERYVACHPTAAAFLKFAKWEEGCRHLGQARAVYERAVEGGVHASQRTLELVVSFARFEERCKEQDRARAILHFALKHVAAEPNDVEALNHELVAFEKRHGAREEIEDAILSKRRTAYETAVATDRFDYDSWFDLTRLEEAVFGECAVAAAANGQGVLQEVDLRNLFTSSSAADAGTGSQAALHSALLRTRDAYERAIAQVPLSNEKRFWRRYIYLWICYALFEELTVKDKERARQVYKACLAVVPHKKFTFTKIWLQAAFLEVRCKDLASARKLLGQALGVCAQFNHAKPSIFKGYISLELQLGEVERCRSIYNKFLEVMPAHCAAWKEYSALEARVGESSRSRAIYELGVSQPDLDAPEGLWKAYIDFEVGEGEPQRVRGLYERLLARAPHVKVWVAFALFEAGLGAGTGAGAGAVDGAGAGDGAGPVVVPAEAAAQATERSRNIFTQGYAALKEAPGGRKEDRVALLEAWLAMERSAAATESAAAETAETSSSTSMSTRYARPDIPEALFPRKVRARRMAIGPDGQELGWEEFYDFIFPDEAKKPTGLKILENALKWKAAAAAVKAGGAGAGAGGGGAGGGGGGCEGVEQLAGSRDGDGDGAFGSGASAAVEMGQGQAGGSSSSSLGKRKAATAGSEIDIDDI